MRFGACMRFARFAARFGMPTQTRTLSPSLSSRAAIVTMSSLEVTVGSVIVTRSRSPRARHGPASAGAASPSPGPAFSLTSPPPPPPHPVAPLLHPFHRGLVLLRDVIPGHVERVVPVVVALGVRRVRAPRFPDDRANDEVGDQGAVRVRADDLLEIGRA